MVAKKMAGICKKLFVDNWGRKVISFIVAIILWFIVNDSFSKAKNYTSAHTETIEEVR